jgi:hypothetical protein
MRVTCLVKSAQAWTTQTRANLSNRMEYIAKPDALESTSLPSPSPSPSPPLAAATLAPTDVDVLCESTPDVNVTNLPLPREKASGPSTRWNRRKNSMKLAVELGSRAQRNRPSARQALSPSLRKPSDSGHPSQPGQPSGGIARLLELFDELMASRMENLQCTEEMLRDLHLIA